MSKRPLAFVFGVAVAGVTAIGQASAQQGFYVGALAGPSFFHNNDLEASTPGSPAAPAELDFNTGFTGGGVAGFGWANGIRAEGEASFRRIGTDDITFTGAAAAANAAALGLGSPVFGTDGRLRSISVMANVYYDFDLAPDVMPYIGGGIGVSFLSAEVDSLSLLGVSVPSAFEDNDTVLAYQLMTGVNYHFGDHFTVGIEYRFLGQTGPRFSSNLLAAAPTPVTLDHDMLFSHNVLLSVKYSF